MNLAYQCVSSRHCSRGFQATPRGLSQPTATTMSSLVASPPRASRSLALRARVASRARVAPVASVACSRSRRATVVVASGPVRRPAHRLDDARLVPVVPGALHRARSIPRATSILRAADGDSTELSDGVTLDRALELSSVVKFAVPLLATNIVKAGEAWTWAERGPVRFQSDGKFSSPWGEGSWGTVPSPWRKDSLHVVLDGKTYLLMFLSEKWAFVAVRCEDEQVSYGRLQRPDVPQKRLVF